MSHSNSRSAGPLQEGASRVGMEQATACSGTGLRLAPGSVGPRSPQILADSLPPQAPPPALSHSEKSMAGALGSCQVKERVHVAFRKHNAIITIFLYRVCSFQGLS